MPKSCTRKNAKICRKCGERNCIYFGKKRGKQRYKCRTCGYIFCNASRRKKIYDSQLNAKLWHEWSYKRQTYENLSDDYGISQRTVQRRLDAHRLMIDEEIIATSIVLLVDTTYFGSDLGIMAFKEAQGKKILKVKIVENESLSCYLEGIQELEEQGWSISAVVCDGKRGLLGGCMKRNGEHIPTQMCHFHQSKIITRYITKRPRLEANKELRSIALLLSKTDKETFTYELGRWYMRWESFLNERGEDEHGKKYYIHRRTRSAYTSLKRNLKYLFVFYDYLGEVDIPNTTNGLEGGTFSHLKEKVGLHRGLHRKRKIKLIFSLLNVPLSE